ncbi:hypothetical protein MRBBS_0420 [Marinobacter sp. BSs20148]|nr:hypothetical protein MRBBS_0420 [Marinobacter sp. BSs20148]
MIMKRHQTFINRLLHLAVDTAYSKKVDRLGYRTKLMSAKARHDQDLAHNPSP